MSNKAFVGKTGEELACQYLGSHGYSISFRNYRKKWGEIDIVAKDPDGILVFVEVKTMVGLVTNNELKPEDNLTAAKLKKLQRTARLFAGFHPDLVNDKLGWRIDLVAILINERGEKFIKHYENI